MFETTQLGSSKQNRVNPGPKTQACQARLGLLSIRALHELGICMPPVLHILEEVQFHDISCQFGRDSPNGNWWAIKGSVMLLIVFYHHLPNFATSAGPSDLVAAQPTIQCQFWRLNQVPSTLKAVPIQVTLSNMCHDKQQWGRADAKATFRLRIVQRLIFCDLQPWEITHAEADKMREIKKAIMQVNLHQKIGRVNATTSQENNKHVSHDLFCMLLNIFASHIGQKGSNETNNL